MIRLTLALQQRHELLLKDHLFAHPRHCERAAFLMFGSAMAINPATGETHETFLLKDVLLLQDSEVESSPSSVTWPNDLIIPWLKTAARKKLLIGIAHSHLNYPSKFSATDDAGEQGLLELIQHRNGRGAGLISLVMSSDGTSAARIWRNEDNAESIDFVRSIGDRYDFRRHDMPRDADPELARQALVFGDELNKTVSSLTFTIVGCGGTGSAIAMLLARLGGKNFVLVDHDTVELTNLNRLHGARHRDVTEGRTKVEVVARNIRDIAPTSNVQTFQCTVDDQACRAAVLSSDIVFGCTDDNRGRLLINRLAYFYLIPVIDVGLAIEVSKKRPYRILALDGRVTCIGPGETCLLCRGVISPRRAREEALKAADPAEYARQKEEAYVIGEGNPSPAVATFTTEVATMALNELLHRLHGFRGPNGSTPSRTRQFHRMHDLRPGDMPRDDCPVCGSDFYWGLGDITPFLDQVW